MRLTLRLPEEDGSLIVGCVGQITENAFMESSDPLLDLIGREGLKRKVRLDLEQTDYIDSSGIGWLVGCHNRFRQAGGEFFLIKVPPAVSRILEFCGLDNFLKMERG
jgi:anti-anti-sigma factor